MFGAVAGVIGEMAAVEVIKLITGIGEPLRNTLLHVNLRTMEFRRLPIVRDPQCPVCGTLSWFPPTSPQELSP